MKTKYGLRVCTQMNVEVVLISNFIAPFMRWNWFDSSHIFLRLMSIFGIHYFIPTFTSIWFKYSNWICQNIFFIFSKQKKNLTDKILPFCMNGSVLLPFPIIHNRKKNARHSSECRIYVFIFVIEIWFLLAAYQTFRICNNNKKRGRVSERKHKVE